MEMVKHMLRIFQRFDCFCPLAFFFFSSYNKFIFLQASHRDKNNSSYNNYQDSNLHGDRAVRSYCWSQTSVSSPGNLNVYGQLPSFTQSHAFRPTFKVLTRIYFYSFCTFYPDNLRLKALLFMSSEGKTSLRTVYKTCQSKDKLRPI